MNISKKIFISTIFVSLLFFFLGIDARAKSLREEGSALLVQIAQTAYDRGQYDDAAHEFSKALLIDPSNQKAIKGLNKMGIEKGLYAGTKTGLTSLVDLAKNLQDQNVEKLAILPTSEGAVAAAPVSAPITPTQDRMGNLSREVLKEIAALQKDIEQSKRKVAHAKVSQKIAKAEKVMQNADMALAERLLKAPDTTAPVVSPTVKEPVVKSSAEVKPVTETKKLAKKTEAKKSINQLAYKKPVVAHRAQTFTEPQETMEPEALEETPTPALDSDETQMALKVQGRAIDLLEEQMRKSAQEALDYEKKMTAILDEQNEAKDKALEQEETNRQMLAVLEDYLYAKQQNPQKSHAIEYRLELASAHNTLLERYDELHRLYKDLDHYLAKVYEKGDIIDEKNTDILYFKEQLDQKKENIRELEEQLQTSVIK
ncbi:MAG: hypothetical protein HQL24_05995 [Candidatus Omnitrophica bacterium]|nr:hypothetical protein [Candidatus Omnitrophota bacterium]